jgi:hypothetical protein
MMDRAQTTRPEGPYRSPGRALADCSARPSGWVVFLIDACVVLAIAGAVVMVPRWPALVDVAARRFLGF